MKVFRCLPSIHRILNLQAGMLKIHDAKTNDCVVVTFQHIWWLKMMQNMERNICVQCLHPRISSALFEFRIQLDNFNIELKNVCATKLQN